MGGAFLFLIAFSACGGDKSATDSLSGSGGNAIGASGNGITVTPAGTTTTAQINSGVIDYVLLNVNITSNPSNLTGSFDICNQGTVNGSSDINYAFLDQTPNPWQVNVFGTLTGGLSAGSCQTYNYIIIPFNSGTANVQFDVGAPDETGPTGSIVVLGGITWP